MDNFKFIDLFSGIGGFHQAMEHLGGECSFSAEIDSRAIAVYKANYGIDSARNLVDVDPKEIPSDFDVLCAGFPCQPFSKAGHRLGFLDTRGTLFFEIEKILNCHHPKYILLENVRNLTSHDDGRTWDTIRHSLINLGYRVPSSPLILSPHHFGVPQLRERVVIPGIFSPEDRHKPLKLELGELLHKSENDAYSVIDTHRAPDSYYLSDYELNVLEAWDDFYQGIDIKTIGFPVWASVFTTPPDSSDYPDWKKLFIEKNIELYNRNKTFIDVWLEENNNLENFVPTHRKFEWQAGDRIRSIWDGLIQFRPSGIRVKEPTCFPALVAMVHTPIIGKYKRRLTLREAAKLQSFDEGFVPDSDKQAAYKQFGNAVNVKVIESVARELFRVE